MKTTTSTPTKLKKIKTQFTPAPWYLDYGGGYGKGHVFSDSFPKDSLGGKCSLAAVHFPALYESGSLSKEAFDISEANAKLIAAAPELLEALIECEKVLWMHTPEFTKAGFNAADVIDKAKSAIKKATE